MHPLRRHARVLVVVATTFTATARADTANECADAAELGQQQRDQGKLALARSEFLRCARSECPEAVARSCTTWLADVSQRQPTVVLQVVDADGRDLPEAQVSVDGRATDAHASGVSIPLDPGIHDVRATSNGGITSERFVVREREQGRAIRVVVKRASPREAGVSPAEPPSRAGVLVEPSLAVEPPGRLRSPAFWIPSSLAVVGFGTFAGFGLSGLSTLRRLEDTCARPCTDSDLDTAQRNFVIADIGLAVGTIALGTVIYFLIRDGGASTAR